MLFPTKPRPAPGSHQQVLRYIEPPNRPGLDGRAGFPDRAADVMEGDELM